MGVTIIRKPSVRVLVFGPKARKARVELHGEKCSPNPSTWPFSNTLPSHIWTKSFKDGGWCCRCLKKRGPDDDYPIMTVPAALRHQVQGKSQ